MGRSVPDPQQGDASALRVLVVDDNADTAESLAMMLALDGHMTRVAMSDAEACRLAGKFAPHLVLIEAWLSGLDAYQVIRQLRELPQTAGALLVAITGHGDVDARENAAAAGCDAHLVAPFEPDQLGRLAKRAALRARQAAVFTRRG